MRRISDKNGGIEGVPLQLIIAVVVGMAALGTKSDQIPLREAA